MKKIVFRKEDKYIINVAEVDIEDVEILSEFIELAKKKSWILTVESEEDKRIEGIN